MLKGELFKKLENKKGGALNYYTNFALKLLIHYFNEWALIIIFSSDNVLKILINYSEC